MFDCNRVHCVFSARVDEMTCTMHGSSHLASDPLPSWKPTWSSVPERLWTPSSIRTVRSTPRNRTYTLENIVGRDSQKEQKNKQGQKKRQQKQKKKKGKKKQRNNEKNDFFRKQTTKKKKNEKHKEKTKKKRKKKKDAAVKALERVESKTESGPIQ